MKHFKATLAITAVLIAVSFWVWAMAELITYTENPVIIKERPSEEYIITQQGDTAWVHYDTIVHKSYRLKLTTY